MIYLNCIGNENVLTTPTPPACRLLNGFSNTWVSVLRVPCTRKLEEICYSLWGFVDLCFCS